jgi:hypothetical protein
MSTVQEIITRIKTEFLDDNRGGTDAQAQWRTADLVAALNSSEREIAHRLLLIQDSITPSVCRINIAKVSGVYPQSYAHSPKIVRIERLMYPNVALPLPRKTLEQFDNEAGIRDNSDYPIRYIGTNVTWQGQKGTPFAYTLDFSRGYVTFNRVPTVTGVVTMTVKRLPLVNMTADNLETSPEIQEYDDVLIHGALKYAYLKDDSETFDPVRSGVWSKQFEADIKQIELDQAALNPRSYIMRPERF